MTLYSTTNKFAKWGYHTFKQIITIIKTKNNIIFYNIPGIEHDGKQLTSLIINSTVDSQTM